MKQLMKTVWCAVQSSTQRHDAVESFCRPQLAQFGECGLSSQVDSGVACTTLDKIYHFIFNLLSGNLHLQIALLQVL